MYEAINLYWFTDELTANLEHSCASVIVAPFVSSTYIFGSPETNISKLLNSVQYVTGCVTCVCADWAVFGILSM